MDKFILIISYIFGIIYICDFSALAFQEAVKSAIIGNIPQATVQVAIHGATLVATWILLEKLEKKDPTHTKQRTIAILISVNAIFLLVYCIAKDYESAFRICAQLETMAVLAVATKLIH